MDKYEISKIFEEIGMMMELKGENPFKIRAYYNGARTVELMEEDIKVLVEENRLNTIKGIGKALEGKIIELVETGKLEFYDKLKEEIPEGVMEMLKIPGVGPKKIRELYDKLEITSIGELEYACLENRLVDLKGFGEKTQIKILEGIEQIKKYQGKFLISTGLKYGTYLVTQLKELPELSQVSLAGSIRRRKEIIKDIDIIVSCGKNDRDKVMDFFTTIEGVGKVIAKGDTKSSVVLNIGMNVDLRLVEEGEFAYALLHFTGSKEHNTLLRGRAKKMGLKVNEYGIFREEERLPADTEEELYGLLELDYIPPELREGQGEIEMAEKNQLPNLVEHKDVKGIFHVHSQYSDGRNTIEELVKAAIERGFRYIGISDHSKSAAYAGGLREEDVKKQHREIEDLREKYPQITILKGIESDILVDGSLDYEDEVLASFDYVIGSIHSNFNLDEETMTNRILKAVQNKYTTILGHVTGRLLLSRKGYQLDIEEIIQACADNHVAIEINSNPHRLDLDWRLCRYAKEKGVKLVIEPDAHRIEGLDDVMYGVGIARKGWLESEDVINTMEIEEVLERFKKETQEQKEMKWENQKM
ncbi:DNA polymerase/3'-5' exonuclease PolX [Alkaliphilus hydrothermalis]|uniref:DNA polymerase beta n=1 Tax=Alkaliphilus hydrothermalis TaxID=1482730 RepID=A0ABS2NPJ4_9FIRM|nr:DNA polymerase/3'-5' exonuclease PolX [Alkaliphilus hydrothermalis]MBM7614870.1 DNA polymerase (family 10) [Alkaliphilus hydrothermalis]